MLNGYSIFSYLSRKVGRIVLSQFDVLSQEIFLIGPPTKIPKPSKLDIPTDLFTLSLNGTVHDIYTTKGYTPYSIRYCLEATNSIVL